MSLHAKRSHPGVALLSFADRRTVVHEAWTALTEAVAKALAVPC